MIRVIWIKKEIVEIKEGNYFIFLNKNCIKFLLGFLFLISFGFVNYLKVLGIRYL